MRLSTLALALLLPAAFAAGRVSPSDSQDFDPQGVPPTPGQDPGEIPGGSDADEPEVDPGLVRSPFAAMRAKSTERLRVDFLGAWRLEAFYLRGSAVDQNDIYGFMTIADEYLSVSLHSRSHSSFDDGDELLFFETTMGRWKFDDAGMLLTQSLIGHNNMVGSEITYEQAGRVREFTLDMPDEETLVFVREDQARMVYKRLPLREEGHAKEQALARRRARARGVDPNPVLETDPAGED